MRLRAMGDRIREGRPSEGHIGMLAFGSCFVIIFGEYDVSGVFACFFAFLIACLSILLPSSVVSPRLTDTNTP